MENFFKQKLEKILTKFFSNISIQVGKNLITPSGREYLVTSKKKCLIGYLKELLESYEFYF